MERWMVVLAVVLGITAHAEVAAAFHTGRTFGDPPGAGGGGGIFYLGMPLERGWNCTMCHEDAPGRMEIRVTVEPPELFQSFRYESGATYAFTVKMVWKDGASELGLGAGRSNFNALAVGASDPEGIFAGTLQGGGFVAGSGAGTIASDVGDGVTSWQFNWFAPTEAGRGPVSLYFGAVDGNGADSDPEVTRSDPFGDDVFMAEVMLDERAGGSTQSAGAGLELGWRVNRAPSGASAPARSAMRHVANPLWRARPSRVATSVSAGTIPPSRAAFAALLGLVVAALGGRKRHGLINESGRTNDN